MTSGSLLAGAAVGLGVFLLARALVPPRPGIAVQVARLDAGRRAGSAASSGSDPARNAGSDGQRQVSASSGQRFRARLAAWLEGEATARGWRLPRLRADLAVVGTELGPLLATKVLFAVGALIWVPMLWVALAVFGVPTPPAAPALVTLIAAGLGFVLPDLELRGRATALRRDFRHVVGCFLDLVAMNLAGGRGLPEALLAAASVGEHWAMVRIRSTLANARLTGRTPWEALGELGDEIGLDELRDLAGALTLAADDGAKVRTSLSARAASIRRKELADAEGQAGERSQSMLVAQLLICAAFLVFLAYPATYQILRS
jgi:Flp pilus assembly protein TadB